MSGSEDSELLKGKKIFITGGSMGLGLAVAEKCAQAGARVILASRTEKDLKKAVKTLEEKHPAGHASIRLDVGSESRVKKAAAWVKEKFGSIDGLVNCAGVYGPIGRLDQIDMDDFTDTIRINFLGTVYMCHHFLPLLKGPGARIVNFSGGGAATPFPNYSAYATSKIAVVRLTENLSQELEPLGIAVNAVAPGFVITRLHQETLKAGKKAGASFLESTKKQIEKGGVPPEKAANLTVFLLSRESDGINGKFISAPWDGWEDPSFVEKLKTRKGLATLRRIDDRSFVETNHG